jgi:hypothetical protein
MVEGGPVLLHHGLRRKEKQHSLNPNISPIYLFLPHSFITLRCHNRGGKAVGPSQDAIRGMVNQVYMPPLLLTHHTSYDSMGYGNRIPNGSYNCQGAAKLRVPR